MRIHVRLALLTSLDSNNVIVRVVISVLKSFAKMRISSAMVPKSLEFCLHKPGEQGIMIYMFSEQYSSRNIQHLAHHGSFNSLASHLSLSHSLRGITFLVERLELSPNSEWSISLINVLSFHWLLTGTLTKPMEYLLFRYMISMYCMTVWTSALSSCGVHSWSIQNPRSFWLRTY